MAHYYTLTFFAELLSRWYRCDRLKDPHLWEALAINLKAEARLADLDGSSAIAAEFAALSQVAEVRAHDARHNHAERLRSWLREIEFKDFLTQDDKNHRASARAELTRIESQIAEENDHGTNI